MSQDLTALAKVRLEELLTFFGINTKVKAAETEGRIDLDVEVADTARLIGRHGETLKAIQHLVNMMVRRETTERVFVRVDIAGYHKARGEAAEQKARDAAQSVLETGQPVTLPPMTPAERRLVHVVLSEIPELASESIGEDPKRQVVIKKKS